MNSEGFATTASPSGWMDATIKSNWFDMIFLKNIDITQNHFLLLDGHSSNLDPDFIEKAKQKNITVVIFPANSTHLLQPLDSNYFRILKDGIRKELANFKKLESKWDLCQLLSDPVYKANAPGVIKKSFEIPGIFPTCWKLDHVFKDKEETFKHFLNPNSTPSVLDPSPQTIELNQTVSTEMFQIESLPESPVSNALVPYSSNPLNNFPSYSISQTVTVSNNIMEKLNKIIEKFEEPKKGTQSYISTKRGLVITSQEMDGKLKERKRKKLEKESKSLKE